MARKLKDNESLVQIGHTAMRRPDGSFLPSQPMYVIVSDEQINPKSCLSEGEEDLCADIAGVLAGKFKQYMDGLQAADLKP